MEFYSHYCKNVLRIYEAHICEKVKNTEAQAKKSYSYKKTMSLMKTQKNVKFCMHNLIITVSW